MFEDGDDDDDFGGNDQPRHYVRGKNLVHYGSLEEGERLRQQQQAQQAQQSSQQQSSSNTIDIINLPTIINNNNNNTSSSTLSSSPSSTTISTTTRTGIPVTVTITGPSSVNSHAINANNQNNKSNFNNLPTVVETFSGNNNEKQNALEEFERQRKARQIAVSTDDIEVRAHLRHLNQPMCLFGEGPADRRERLRQLLARLGEDALKRNEEPKEEKDKETRDKTWYHEGSESLLRARYWIAEFSLPRTKARLDLAREQKEIPLDIRESSVQELYKRMRTMEISSSQVADQRPISSCSFSPDGTMLATSSWSGLCKLWSVPSLECRATLRAHNANTDQIQFHPRATIGQSADALNLASCGAGGAVFLWSLTSEEPLRSLKGHEPYRVSHLDFHPSGRFMATCCYDNSWRLWDFEANEEILHQEGHSKEVHDITFHPDGNLVASGGRDAYGRVWDLRIGRCVMTMESHTKGIISIDFSPNGYQLVTGSEDNTVKIWNVRQRKLEYTISAHNNIVSKVLFEHENGNYIVTSSYDNTIKLWAHPAWTPIKTLSGHDNRVMCVDMSRDNRYLVSSSFDRTFKLWEQYQ